MTPVLALLFGAVGFATAGYLLYSFVKWRGVAIVVGTLVFFVIYVIAPASLLSAGEFSGFGLSPTWRRVIDVFHGLDQHHVYVVLFAGLSIAVMMTSYEIVRRLGWSRIHNLAGSHTFTGAVLYDAARIGTVVGLVAFAVYVQSLGGLLEAMRSGFLIRSGEVETDLGFLVHFAKLCVPASVVFFALVRSGHRSRRTYLWLLVSTAAGLLVLYRLAGRANLVVYILAFVFTAYLDERRFKLRYVAIPAIVVLALIQFGDVLFGYFVYENPLGRRLSMIARGGMAFLVVDTVKEFSFPFTNVLVAIEVVPFQVDYVWFTDILTAVRNVVVIGGERALRVSDVNTAYYGTEGQIPIDLIGYGFRSAGVLGIGVASAAVGGGLGLIDRVLSEWSGPGVSGLYAILGAKLALVVMYADPSQVAIGNLFLAMFVTIVAIVAFFRMGIAAGADTESRDGDDRKGKSWTFAYED